MRARLHVIRELRSRSRVGTVLRNVAATTGLSEQILQGGLEHPRLTSVVFPLATASRVTSVWMTVLMTQKESQDGCRNVEIPCLSWAHLQ